ncbi:MAG: glycosyltransferase family 4 protein [Bryobacteraceae bacterium]|nr:glycosyltransferase family 4 protein [Bryobacterales bacterium]MEB2362689.1 glycosyltransferase family 1 protein [Bryobacterales bacterium]NUN00585.1 glycosyltransferase family 4 protein [Bryobacteraceae bacterium]
MALRIGVNALYLIPGGVGGTEIYLRSILAAMACIDGENEYFLFTNRETGADLVPAAPNFHFCPQAVSARSRPARILWEQTALPLALVKTRIDVLFNPGFTAPLLCPCPMVTVFHDMQHKRHPEYFRWFDLPFWRMLLLQAAVESHTLIAVSEATRNDILKYYRLPEKRIRVIPHGVDPLLFHIGERTGNFILCISTLHPHKNLERLVRAFANFRRAHQAFRLVLAGLRGFHAEEIERLIKSLNLEAVVEITGWIPREQLRDLFRRAWAFIYPSTFEGFGMPVLEALAAGIPSACSDIEPLACISGSAALHFDPDDENAIANTLAVVTGDAEVRERLIAAGPLRARQFSWKTTARETLDALGGALAQDVL